MTDKPMSSRILKSMPLSLKLMWNNLQGWFGDSLHRSLSGIYGPSGALFSSFLLKATRYNNLVGRMTESVFITFSKHFTQHLIISPNWRPGWSFEILYLCLLTANDGDAIFMLRWNASSLDVSILPWSNAVWSGVIPNAFERLYMV